MPYASRLFCGSAFLAFSLWTTPAAGSGFSTELAFVQDADSSECAGDECEKSGDLAKDPDDKKAPKVKDIADFVKDKDRIAGLFPFYRDPLTGTIYMEVAANQFEREYIYHTYVHSGYGGIIGMLTGVRAAGDMFDNYVFSMRRRYKSVDIVRRNTEYIFDEGSTLQLGQRANIPDSVMATVSIVAKDAKDERFILAVNSLFQGKDLLRIGEGSGLAVLIGISPKLSKSKSNIQEVRNYPRNSEILAEYVFDFSKGLPTTSTILQHTLAEMPAEGFTARQEDARVGFFTVRRTNLSTTRDIPVEDRIRRWRLQKKDPTSPLSEPVTPITYWIQNTTPHEYRDTIRDAVLRWNPVFEAAGFRNAIEVKVQPDDAKWDAGDVRYNVIQWVASPNPTYSGYGPTVVNPRTGEIIGANIVIEHNHVRRNKLVGEIFDLGATNAGSQSPGEQSETHSHKDCMLPEALLQGQVFAELVALTQELGLHGDTEAALSRITKDSLTYVVMHEIGHTLGLTHNLKASYFQDVETLRRASAGAVTSGSIMDYPAVNILPHQGSNAAYFPTAPGPYDYWAIRYGYDSAMDDDAAKKAHLALAEDPGLVFGNDSDAMRRSSDGVDPRVMPFDMSADPIAFAASQLTLIEDVRPKLAERLVKPGESWDVLVRAHNVLQSIYRQHITTISRYVGGVYVDRSMAGEGPEGAAPFRPVPAHRQRAAMQALATYVFAPSALQIPQEIQIRLLPLRRGQSGVEAPSPHSDAAEMQSIALNHLLHQAVINRLVDSGQYGNSYDVATMLGDLSEAIFGLDQNGSVTPQRQNLQAQYVRRLLKMVEQGYGYDTANAAIYSEVQALDKRIKASEKRGDQATQAHRAYMRRMIAKAFES